MARIEYLRHKRIPTTLDDGVSDIQPQRDWAGDAHAQVGILGFDNVIKTLATGAFVIADTLQVVAAESGTADDLDSITATDAQANDICIIKADTGDTITVKHGTGNIQLPGGQDIVLDASKLNFLILMYDGTNWRIPRTVGNAIIDDNNNIVILLGKTASAVNYVKITNAATGNAARISSEGETNVPLLITGKGTGKIRLADGADATKYITLDLAGMTTAKALTLISAITDNRSITFPDATGTLALLSLAQTWTAKQTLYGVTDTVATLTYGATTDIDMNLEETMTLALTGNVTFTTSNKGTGKRKTIKILADGSTRTFTFPSWKFVGAAAPASIAANKTAILTLECFGANDTDIVAAYAVEP